jgi:hypothetical protein
MAARMVARLAGPLPVRLAAASSLRVGDDADRGVGHQPVAAHPRAVGVLLTHRPPCPPPSRVPSPGYAFPQPLTRVTIVI